MGLLDHRRQWHYVVNAAPADCVAAFVAAFSGKGGLVVKARWDIRSGRDRATATYQGRKGIGAIAGILSATSNQEADTAIGSTVEFATKTVGGGRTECSMALTSSGRSGIAGILGATSDGRFIRPYMQAVAEEIRRLDPHAQITAG
jgi:hypothetical protein